VRRLQNSKFQVYRQKHQGRGQALITGILKSTGDAIIFQDADLEYDPSDWPKLLKKLEEPNTDVVYGSRTLNPKRKGYSHYVLGARLLTNLINLLYKSKLSDLYTGYKLFRYKILKSLTLTSSGFEFEVEITSKLLKRGVKIEEVPIAYYPRRFSEGKKITMWDGIKGFWCIIKYKFLISLL